jgi:hypothetical protein
MRTKKFNSNRTKVSKDLIGGHYVSNTNSVPIAFNNFEGNGSFISSPTSVLHPTLGIQGTTIHGCQPFSDIGTSSLTSNVLTSGTLATLTVSTVISITPEELNGPISSISRNFEKFVFRDIVIEYVSQTSTTTPGSFAMCMASDGANAFLHYSYMGPELFFNNTDLSSNTEERLTIQASLVAYASSSSVVAQNVGYTNIWYSLELYQPSNQQGFSLTVGSLQELALLKAYLKNIRERALDSKTDSPVIISRSESDEKCELDYRPVLTNVTPFGSSVTLNTKVPLVRR